LRRPFSSKEYAKTRRKTDKTASARFDFF